ncbi:hypothetical protein Q5H93_10305 [Hymenobacter sp. ASUV-10]|uniref:Roadblock/LAMTOR2 domain-containing protein n=1 Tax=Hymenobacter aranciens TaxID=3063996 RepID=A0ABT9BBV5_9BACT|nr:hypothetical protein [Hymenobacter sp. ASUV-10]MDO7875123.1 hypothetical protein [Hymenobacter sp. ASUV-10]
MSFLSKIPFLNRVSELLDPLPEADRAQAAEVVRSVMQDLPELLSATVIDIETGRILAEYVAEKTGNTALAAAAHAEMVKQKRQAMTALQLGPEEQLEDILVTQHQQLHLMRVLHNGQWLLSLAANMQDTNLGIVRTVLHTHAT